MHFQSPRKSLRQLVILICIVVLLASALYIVSWFANRARILQDSEKYSLLYSPEETAEEDETDEPSAGETTPEPSVEPTASPASSSTEEDSLPEVEDQPLSTAESDALILSLPTNPPVQDSFAELLEVNSDTIGFLRIDDTLSLPVVQRENDNEYYLTHNFEQEEAQEGTLFLDGLNLLVPEDGCLIIYGHNMQNGTMFGSLDNYADLEYLIEHPIIYFDTIYENYTYVPFAMFSASVDSDSSSYFNVRQFLPDGEDATALAESLKARSILDIPIDVQSDDKLLLLVTCEYTHSNGRFILALRRLRDDETEESVAALVAQSE